MWRDITYITVWDMTVAKTSQNLRAVPASMTKLGMCAVRSLTLCPVTKDVALFKTGRTCSEGTKKENATFANRFKSGGERRRCIKQ